MTLDAGLFEEAPTHIELDAFTAIAGALQITLDWTTGTEVDTEVFHLWRSEAENGTYTRVTGSRIPARGDPVSGASYHHMDTGLSCKTYRYRLEDVTSGGRGTLHGPVSATVEQNCLYLPYMNR